MNETEARTLREAHNAYVKRLSRQSRLALAVIYRDDLADQGRALVSGGPLTRDELISALCELHYPAAKLNEAGHVLYHDSHGYTACELCHDSDGTHDGHLCECNRWPETACLVCGRSAAFHYSSTYRGDQRPTLTPHDRLGHFYQGRIVEQARR